MEKYLLLEKDVIVDILFVVRWNLDNLKEVISLIGLHESVKNLSWEEYQKLVDEKGLKVFFDGVKFDINLSEYFVSFKNKKNTVIFKEEQFKKFAMDNKLILLPENLDISAPNNLENNISKSQENIVEISDAMKDLLIYKNKKYGDSALSPINIFNKLDAKSSIAIRLDDKISRVKNCKDLLYNDICDLIGYCILLLISMKINKYDIEKLKD